MRTLLVLMFLVAVIPQAHANLRDGLVGWYKLDEATGVNSVDYSGQGNNGTLVGPPTSVPGKRGNALYFNGSTQYVKTTSTTGFPTGSSARAISFWVKQTARPAAFAIIVGYGAGASNQMFGAYTDPSGVLWGWHYGAGSDLSTGTTLSLNTWYCVVIEYDGSDTIIYINGTLVVSAPKTVNTGSGACNFVIGYDCQDSNYSFTGSIDEVRVFNRLLTAQEIADLYKSGTVIKNAVIRGNSRINQ